MKDWRCVMKNRILTIFCHKIALPTTMHFFPSDLSVGHLFFEKKIITISTVEVD